MSDSRPAKRLLPAALFSFLVFASPAFAFDFDGGSEPSLSRLVKGLSEEPLALKAPAPSTAPVSSELQSFWEKLKNDTVDSICKSAEIKLNKDGRLDSGPGIGGEFKRALRKDARGKLFLIQL